jgi:enolase
MTMIIDVHGRQVLDSRGNPTVEVEVRLESGAEGHAIVPSGASTGSREAVELRDGDPKRYLGKGVAKAVRNVNRIIGPKIIGFDATEQAYLDGMLIELDGTENKGRLGANAILGVSLAVARAAAEGCGLPFYQYLGGAGGRTLPVPMLNILNGGSHADNNVDIQEFMVMPIGGKSFSEALRMGVETFHHLKKVLKGKGLNTNVGDEGGFAPLLRSNAEAIEVILEAIVKAGYKPGKDIGIALDAAASEFYEKGKYVFRKSDGSKRTADGMVKYYEGLSRQYPILSIEDGFAENDWKGWKLFTQAMGKKIQIVGRDRKRDDRCRGDGQAGRMDVRRVPPVRRDGGQHDRRPRSRPEHGSDQNGFGVADRSACQVQPTSEDRGGTGALREVRGEGSVL